MSSCTSLESLRGSAPFRLPLWDRASAEFCFARSRDLLTRRTPRLDSSIEMLESSEPDETVSISYGARRKSNEPLRRCKSNEPSDVANWKSRRHIHREVKKKYPKYELDSRSSIDTSSIEGTVTKSQSTDSASTLDACPSLNELNESSTLKDCNGGTLSSSTLKGENSLSSLNDCSLAVSDYSNLNYDTAGSSPIKTFSVFEKSYPESTLQNASSVFVTERQPLSSFVRKYSNVEEKTYETNSFEYRNDLKDVCSSPEKLLKYSEKYPKECEVRLSFKQLERHLDSLDITKKNGEPILERKNSGKNYFPRPSVLNKVTSNSLTKSQFVPQTPIFRRKMPSQFKNGESQRSQITKSSPNSPSISLPKVHYRPRTNSLTEEKISLPITRRQSYNYSTINYDSSSSDSDYGRNSSLRQGQIQCRTYNRESDQKPSTSHHWSSTSSSSEDLSGYPEFSEDFLVLSASHQIKTKF